MFPRYDIWSVSRSVPADAGSYVAVYVPVPCVRVVDI